MQFLCSECNQQPGYMDYSLPFEHQEAPLHYTTHSGTSKDLTAVYYHTNTEQQLLQHATNMDASHNGSFANVPEYTTLDSSTTMSLPVQNSASIDTSHITSMDNPIKYTMILYGK